MVSFFSKKSPNSKPLGSSPNDGGKKNQLVHTVSPFDECLETHGSLHFKKGFKTIRRKHSAQRDLLAKLKAKEILQSSIHRMDDSDHVPNMERQLMTGLLPAPARSKPTAHTLLSKSILLRRQGTPREPILSKATMTKTKDKTSSMVQSSNGRKKYFRPTSCYDNIYPMIGGICDSIPTTGDHEIPFVISFSPVNNHDDSSSDISLEDADLSTLTATTATSSGPPSSANNASVTSSGMMPTYSRLLASAGCMPMQAGLDLQYSESSISWPSDEDEEENEDEREDDEVLDEAAQDELDRSSLQLITEVRELDCTEDIDSEVIKADFGSRGGTIAWSGDVCHNVNLKPVFKVSGDAKSTTAGVTPAEVTARDEENCRDDTSGDKLREEIIHRLESF